MLLHFSTWQKQIITIDDLVNICKCFLRSIVKFIFKSFHTNIDYNYLKRPNVEMSRIPLQE